MNSEDLLFRNATVLSMDPTIGVLNGGDKIFRPQDVYAGNLLSAVEALDAGVTTTLDLAYGNLHGAPWEWANSPEFRNFVDRHVTSRDDLLGTDLDRVRAAVADTVEFARREIGEPAWQESMCPEIPDTERIPNRYTYTGAQE